MYDGMMVRTQLNDRKSRDKNGDEIFLKKQNLVYDWFVQKYCTYGSG